MRVLSGAEVAALVGVVELIEPIAAAMVEVSAGNAEMPLRSMVKLAGANHMGVMAGHLGQPAGHARKIGRHRIKPADPAVKRDDDHRRQRGIDRQHRKRRQPAGQLSQEFRRKT